MASKMSPTPRVQEDKLVEGGWLSSKSCRYQVQSILGEGTFGKVAKCTKVDDSKTVAIKMVKKRNDQAEKANAEVVILEKLKSLNADKCNIVQWYQVFNNNGYICLEFELLDKSLFDFMKERFFRPLFLSEIRPIIKQLANALEHLKSIRLIHADLKLENVMLVNHTQQPYRVKVIDFGLACEASNAKVCSYIQSRPYRFPEIILGLPFTEAIDMWSLGCIAAALYIGTLLYPGNSSYDVLRLIKTDNYADKAAEMADVLMFVDMLKGMLHLDAAKRITPRQVLDHPFLSMRHIDSMYPLSNHPTVAPLALSGSNTSANTPALVTRRHIQIGPEPKAESKVAVQRETDEVSERPKPPFTFPRYDAPSPTSHDSLVEARLKVHLARLLVEAQERAEARQDQLTIRKMEIEAEKAIRRAHFSSSSIQRQ
ncbi:homeodomain-interacting protein kinase 2-like [Echeneis naucrates]|uniref:homeodomain-interacting protein kinase 2-like n=1 Tax=Echeneis naucrates TaxID=173247 RepID=UPI001114058D|nr:homeodomain-interacting protein kinase 2-like [Echeneis naucrates]